MRGTLLVAAQFLLPTAAASGAEQRVAETVTVAGDPALTVSVWPWQGEAIEWRRCAGGGPVCEPIPPGAYLGGVNGGSVAFPGETPAGTVFEAVVAKDGVEIKTRTRAWQGRVRPAIPPAWHGEAAVGKAATAAPGAWAGGWGSSNAYSGGIFACRERSGGDCWQIASGSTVVPEPRWAGWYLFAQDDFPLDDPLCHQLVTCAQTVGASLLQLPAHIGPQAGPTFALSAPLGPIAAEPTASIRTRALRRNGRLHVGRVSCESGCSVQVKVSGGRRRAVYETTRVTGTKALTVPVRHGKLKVRVVVDGKLAASGRTLAH